MTLSDLIAYYLGANYDYNEELKHLLESSNIYDFCSDERTLVAFTPYKNRLYLKVRYQNGDRMYLPMGDNNPSNKVFDGGNIIVKNLESLNKAKELINKNTRIPLNRRLSKRIIINIDDCSYEAYIVNFTCEQLCVYINASGKFLYLKYDYETNSFSANFDIDWYRLSETTIEPINIPDIVMSYINNNGEKHIFRPLERDIEIKEYVENDEIKKYFYKLR